jgi:predicted HicB family RNase H-like nuclease
MGIVSVQKVSVSLDESVLLAAREAAKRRGMSLSAWVNQRIASAIGRSVELYVV